MSPDLLQFLGSLFGAGVLAAVVNAFFNRRKLSAEATEIISKAAASTVERVEADNARLRKEMDEMRLALMKEIGGLEQEVARQREALAISENRERVHLVMEERGRAHLERWHRHCARQNDVIRSLGGVIEDCPPLFPEPLVVPGY